MISTERLGLLIDRTLTFALAGEESLAELVVEELRDQGDAGDAYAFCLALSEVGRTALLDLFGDLVERGACWELGDYAETCDDPHDLFAARFLTAHMNDDADMRIALLQAAEAAGRAVRHESLLAYLAYVIDLHRRAAAVTHQGGTCS